MSEFNRVFSSIMDVASKHLAECCHGKRNHVEIKGEFGSFSIGYSDHAGPFVCVEEVEDFKVMSLQYPEISGYGQSRDNALIDFMGNVQDHQSKIVAENLGNIAANITRKYVMTCNALSD